MKIIQANKFYYLRGGAEKYMLDLSSYLESQGHEVIPFAMASSENLSSKYEQFFPSFVQTQKVRFGLSGLRTVGRMLYSLQARRKLATLVHRTKPDLCHLHNVYTQLSPSILHTLKDQRVPVVMTVHDHHLVSPQYNVWAEGCGDDVRTMNAVQAINTKFHKQSRIASTLQVATFSFHALSNIYKKNVDLFLCPSTYMKKQLLKAGFDRNKVRVVRYGIDVAGIQPSYTSKGYMIYFGRLSEEKGVETVVHLAKMLPDIDFKIVGKGPKEKYLHLLSHGCKNIEFTGFRKGEELNELVRNSMAVLLPSRVHETFPLVTLEAMALGKPVIASHVGGIDEIVQDRTNGFLIQPLDMNEWAEQVMRLAYDEELLLQMGRSARETVEKGFTLSRHHKEILEIYQEITPYHV